MKYLENSKISKGKNYLNIVIAIFLIPIFTYFVSRIIRKDHISINGDIIYFVL